MEGRWVQIEQGPVPLRCWWNNPQKESKHVVLVLPEVFGVNSWVRSVVDRLAEQGIPALAMPLFASRSTTLFTQLLIPKTSGRTRTTCLLSF